MSIDLAKFKALAKLNDRYGKQLKRLADEGIATDCIENAVSGTLSSLDGSSMTSLVVYGEPQSGKTEMMICLTAKLLDAGNPIIVHLMNDSVDLLTQNLKRFRGAGLAPAPKGLSELMQASDLNAPKELVVFCKKNRQNLEQLISKLAGKAKIVVIDDEADYATPNSKVNQGTKTKINELVGNLIGQDGCYIGVTATPARLDLNNTFRNDTAKWVQFSSHSAYTGQETFFPIAKKVAYRLTLLDQAGSPKDAEDTLVRFLVTVAYLNSRDQVKEENYTMLVHTSGRKQDHEADRAVVEDCVQALRDVDGQQFEALVNKVHSTALSLYPQADADVLTEYVIKTASRATSVVLNSKRDRKALGDSPTTPSSPFTIIIGGNIISRGVTFPNLLSMFFTRNVKSRLQQDTYIQRARMFGARGKYLEHFELTIPAQLYADWHECFVFHKLALATMKEKLGSPVWIGNSRVSVAADSSIDKATVALDKGEMSFGIFDYTQDLDAIALEDQSNTGTLKKLRTKIGNDALPTFLIDYIEATSPDGGDSLAIHTSSSIENYGTSADQKSIARDKGFIGNPQLEAKKFPKAVHHIKMLRNGDGKARVFYKFKGSLQFIQNLRDTIGATSV